MEALHTKDVRQTHKLLVEHLAAIRKISVFAHCKLVMIFESNLAFESQHLLHAVTGAGIKNWVSLSEGQQGSLGWLTTAERKQQMCLLLRESMTVGKIALAREFFSNELGTAEAKMRIKDELSSYCVVTEAPKTTFGKVRTTYTGKLYGNLGHSNSSRSPFHLSAQTNHCTGKQDDLCIAIQLSLIGCQKVSSCNKTHDEFCTNPALSHTQFFQESKYRNFRAPDYLTPNGLPR